MATNAPAAEVIQISVVSQTGASVQFKVKPGTKLGKVFDAFYTSTGLARSCRFLLNGEKLHHDALVKDAGIAAGDVIDAVAMQVGG